MVDIQSDSLEIGRALKELVRLCEKSGAQFHPDLTIQYHDSDLSAVCQKPNNEHLAALSEENLIPVSSQNFTLDNDCFVLKENADTGWSAIQNDIAHIMFSIFNESEKIKQTKEDSFWLTMQGKDELCAHITKAKKFELNDKRFLDVSKSQEQQDQVVIQNFFNSRVLGLTRDDEDHQRVIMPVIDYLNHNWRGSPFNMYEKDDPFSVSVACRQPIPGSDECFAFYSAMDALDSYIKYGFADQSAPVVRSVPLDIDIQDVGQIQILGVIAKPVKSKSSKLYKNIPRQVPVVGEVKKGKHVRASHIFIPDAKTPYAMKKVLAALIRNVSSKELDEDKMRKIIRTCEEQIVEMNIAYFKKLEMLADSQILRDLSASQLSKINLYVQNSM